MTRIFVGWDPRETAAFHVLCHSIIRHASKPVAIIPLVREQVSDFPPEGSTAFTRTRFLVPYLSNFEGTSIFMDCDFLVRTDLTTLTPTHAVDVVQHDYTPKGTVKMDGQVQTTYPRKNWSSFMLFDNAKCKTLTREYVAHASLKDLHQFAWADDVGSLPLDFNWLVGEYPRNTEARNLHYTLGGPWFEGYEASDHAEDWSLERDAMLGVATVDLETSDSALS